jgi:hypothetical protein
MCMNESNFLFLSPCLLVYGRVKMIVPPESDYVLHCYSVYICQGILHIHNESKVIITKLMFVIT